jgi:hypothetical protein
LPLAAFVLEMDLLEELDMLGGGLDVLVVVARTS